MEAGFSVTDCAPSTQLSATIEHIQVFPPLTTRMVNCCPWPWTTRDWASVGDGSVWSPKIP